MCAELAHAKQIGRGFASDTFPIYKQADIGTFTRLVNKRLDMVITCWKDSRVL